MLTVDPLASWRKVWRDGFAPVLPTAGLVALAQALRDDDARLLQGATTQPPPMQRMQGWPVEGACATAFCGWMDGISTVGEAEEFFARSCFEADQLLGEPAACRYFLTWFDNTPRERMRAELLPEVEAELERRESLELQPCFVTGVEQGTHLRM